MTNELGAATLLLAIGAVAAAGAEPDPRAHACPRRPPAPPPAGIRAGAAAVEITPSVETWDDRNENGLRDDGEPFRDLDRDGVWDPVWLAGFSMRRPAVGVLDPLWARAIVLEEGDGGGAGEREQLAIVALDLIGVTHGTALRCRERAAQASGIAVERIVVASTHTHSGPDTIGLWGPRPRESGCDPEFLARLEEAVARSVADGRAALRPALFAIATARVEDVVRDSRDPDVRDPELVAMRVSGEDGRPIATFLDFAMHPEGLGSRNRWVSSDYAATLREAIERAHGGIAVFASGALGGMQTPRLPDHTPVSVSACGETIAAAAVRALAEAGEARPLGELRVAWRRTELPIDNARFQLALRQGLFPGAGEVPWRGEGDARRPFLPCDLVAARLGPLRLATVPGEAFPEVGFRIKDVLGGEVRALIGLAQNEIGYIVPPDAWREDGYEESMSLGRETADQLLLEYIELARDLDRPRRRLY